MIHFLRRLFQFFRVGAEQGQLVWVVVVVLLLIAYGTTGLYLLEGDVHDPNLTVGDCVWWSVVTMTTVGYGDYFPVTWAGRWLVSAPLMVLGIGVLGYAIGLLTSMVIERQSREAKGMLPYEGQDHVLLCNHPSEELVLEVVTEIRGDRRWKDREIVLLTNSIDALGDRLREAKVAFVKGSPSRKQALVQAGLERAGAVMVLASDSFDPDGSDNQALGSVVSIRAIRKDVHLVVQCVSPEHIELLGNAGASEVVNLGQLSAELMVRGLQDPGVSEVLGEILSNRMGFELYLEPIRNFEGTYGDLERRLREKGKSVALGLVDPDGRRTFAPDPATPVTKGQRVVLIGEVRPEGL